MQEQIPFIKNLPFVEYGKRFFSNGTSDYEALDFSDYDIKKEIERENSILGGIDGLNYPPKTSFGSNIGSISAALVEIRKSSLLGVKKPYLFIHIQARREDEIGGKDAKMHRDFNQIRFTLLAEEQILGSLEQEKDGKLDQSLALYPSLLPLSNTSDHISSFSWDEFALRDYRGVRAQVPTNMSLEIRRTDDFVRSYLPNLGEKLETTIQQNYHALMKNNNTVEFKYTLAEPVLEAKNYQTFLFKLILIQELQRRVGWLFRKPILTFSLDYITDRQVNIRFGRSNNTAGEISSDRDLFYWKSDNSLRFYSSTMKVVVEKKRPDISPLSLDKEAIRVYRIFEKGKILDDERSIIIDENFKWLCDYHHISKKKFYLYEVLDNYSDDNNCLEWIRAQNKTKPDRRFALFSFLENSETDGDSKKKDKMFRDCYWDLELSDPTPKVKELFSKIIERTPVSDLFSEINVMRDERSFKAWNHIFNLIHKPFITLFLEQLLIKQRVGVSGLSIFAKHLNKESFSQSVLKSVEEDFSGLNRVKLSVILLEMMETNETKKNYYNNYVILSTKALTTVQDENINDSLLLDCKRIVDMALDLFNQPFTLLYSQDIYTYILDEFHAKFSISFSYEGGKNHVFWWFKTLLAGFLSRGQSEKNISNLYIKKFQNTYLTSKNSIVNTIDLKTFHMANDYEDWLGYLVSLGKYPKDWSFSKIINVLDAEYYFYILKIIDMWVENLQNFNVIWSLVDIEAFGKNYCKESNLARIPKVRTDDDLVIILDSICQNKNIYNLLYFEHHFAMQWLKKAYEEDWKGLKALYCVFENSPQNVEFVWLLCKIGIYLSEGDDNHFFENIKNWQNIIIDKQFKRFCSVVLSTNITDKARHEIYHRYFSQPDNPAILTIEEIKYLLPSINKDLLAAKTALAIHNPNKSNEIRRKLEPNVSSLI